MQSPEIKKLGTAYRERWVRIRDNHRKALKLRQTKSGQVATNMKPPKCYKELTFLVPYLFEDEDRISNIPESENTQNSENKVRSLKKLRMIHSLKRKAPI